MHLATPEQRDPVGGDLQRADHHRADSARAAGVKYRAVGAAALLRDNLLIYGLGGVIVPFIGIKLIDMVSSLLGLIYVKALKTEVTMSIMLARIQSGLVPC